MKNKQLEKQELSLVELENITAYAGGGSLGDFCYGVLDEDFKGPIDSFFNGLYKAGVIRDDSVRDIWTVCTKAIGSVAIVAATTAFLCVKRIPQKLWRKFSNWIDK